MEIGNRFKLNYLIQCIERRNVNSVIIIKTYGIKSYLYR